MDWVIGDGDGTKKKILIKTASQRECANAVETMEPNSNGVSWEVAEPHACYAHTTWTMASNTNTAMMTTGLSTNVPEQSVKWPITTKEVKITVKRVTGGAYPTLEEIELYRPKATKSLDEAQELWNKVRGFGGKSSGVIVGDEIIEFNKKWRICRKDANHMAINHINNGNFDKTAMVWRCDGRKYDGPRTDLPCNGDITAPKNVGWGDRFVEFGAQWRIGDSDGKHLSFASTKCDTGHGGKDVSAVYRNDGTVLDQGEMSEMSDGYRCGKCTGDSECPGDMVCYERHESAISNGNIKIPGCKHDMGTTNTDYCYTPLLKGNRPVYDEERVGVLDAYSPRYSGMIGGARCEGHCEVDADCRGELICFLRTTNEAIPGCKGGKSGWNYCIDPLGSFPMAADATKWDHSGAQLPHSLTGRVVTVDPIPRGIGGKVTIGNQKYCGKWCDGKYLTYLADNGVGAGLPSGLVAYWPLDGNGDDSSVNGLHMAEMIGLLPRNNGKVGQAYFWQGDGVSGARVADTGNTALDVTKITAAAWVYPTGAGKIINKKNSYDMFLEEPKGKKGYGGGCVQPNDCVSNKCGVALDNVDGCEGKCMRKDWSSTKDSDWNCPRADSLVMKAAIYPCEQLGVGDSLIPPNTWTHIAMTYDGTNIKMFVNALNVYDARCGSSPEVIAVGDEDFRVGSTGGDTPGAGSENFNGRIDEVMLFDRALSATELVTVRSVPQPSCEFHPAGSIIGVPAGDGSSETSPGRDCQVLKLKGITASGVYWIQPDDGVRPFQVYCDQISDDGGWTLVYNIAGDSDMKATSDVNVKGALMDDDATKGTDGKLSDAMLRSLCTEQYKVVQFNKKGESLQNIQYVKIFDQECDGAEIRMYEGRDDNPGWNFETRTRACATACTTKKTPLSGSWDGFTATGFIVYDDSGGSTEGRCFCEESSSTTCSRVGSSAYKRHDFAPSWFCKVDDIEKLGDDIVSSKKCSNTYKKSGSYTTAMTDTTWNHGFSTWGTNGAIITQLLYNPGCLPDQEDCVPASAAAQPDKYYRQAQSTQASRDAYTNRDLTFTKKSSDTVLRIHYYDNVRCHGSSGVSCRWRFLIDGHECDNPGPVHNPIWNGYHGGTNTHHGMSLLGICRSTAGHGDKLPAGSYQLRIHEDSQSSHRHGDPYLGWAGTTWLLEVDEIDKFELTYGKMVTNSATWGSVWGSRYVDFAKSTDATAVRIEYYDNWRCWAGDTCRFELMIDDKHCVEPGPLRFDMYISPHTNTHYGKTMMGYCSRIDQTTYTNRYALGDEWVLATQAKMDELKDGGVDKDYRYEYLFQTTSGNNWIRTPPSTHLWDWDSGSFKMLGGKYWYRNVDSGSQGTFDCNTDGSNREGGAFGVGCSAGGGNNWKALPNSNGRSSSAKFHMCYDYVNYNIGGGCGGNCCEATVKVRRAGKQISSGNHRVSVKNMGAVPGYNAGDPYLGWAYTVKPTWDIQEVQNNKGRIWSQIGEKTASPRHVISIDSHYDTRKRGNIDTHQMDFKKIEKDTTLRISWYDNFRCQGGNTHCRWEVLIDGNQCDTNGGGDQSMRVDMYNHIGGYGNMHMPLQVINMCHNVGVGAHTIQIKENSPGGWTGNPALGFSNKYDHVGRGTTAVIEVEEIGAVLDYAGRLYYGARLGQDRKAERCPHINFKDCGFTLLAQEKEGSRNLLRKLGQSFGKAGDESFNIGPSYLKKYDEIAIKWGTDGKLDKFVRFVLSNSDNIFDDSESKRISIKDVIYDKVSSAAYIQGYTGQKWYQNNNNEHYFCRAAYKSTNPDGTSWGVVPYDARDRNNNGCTATSNNGWGFHYAGDYSSGAGWLGPTCHGCDKGYSRWNEIGQPEIQVWVRKIDDAPAYCDGNGGCTTQVFCRSPAEKSTGGTCYFSKVSKLTPFSGLWASKCQQGKFVGLESSGSHIKQWVTLRCGGPIRVALYAASRPGFDQATLSLYADIHDGINARSVLMGSKNPSQSQFERLIFDYTPQCLGVEARVGIRIQNDSPAADDTAVFVDRISVEIPDTKIFDIPVGLGSGFYSILKATVSVDGYFGTRGVGMAPSGLVGYWKFNGNQMDSSGYAHTLNDGTTPAYTSLGNGRFDQALLMSANLNVKRSESGTTKLDVDHITMAAWVYITKQSDVGTVLSKAGSYWMGIAADGTLRGEFPAHCNQFGDVKLPFNAWSHVAVTYDGRQQNHFINGKWVAEQEGCNDGTGNVKNLEKNDQDVRIGSNNGDSAGTQYFIGRIDEAMIYERALSTSEIQMLMLLPDREDNEFTFGLTDGETTWSTRVTDRSTIDVSTTKNSAMDANGNPLLTSTMTGHDKSYKYEHATVKEGSSTGGYTLKLDYGSGTKMDFTVQTLNSWMPPYSKTVESGDGTAPSREGHDLRLVGFSGGKGKQRISITKMRVDIDTKKIIPASTLLYALCQHDRVRWVNDDTDIKSKTGDGTGDLMIDCGENKVIAYGFTVHHSSVRGTSTQKECLRGNNKICNIGERTCTVKNCRQGNLPNRDITFVYAVCQPSTAVTFKVTDFKAIYGDGTKSASLTCPGRRFAYGVGLQHSENNRVVSSSDGGAGKRRRLHQNMPTSYSSLRRLKAKSRSTYEFTLDEAIATLSQATETKTSTIGVTPSQSDMQHGKEGAVGESGEFGRSSHRRLVVNTAWLNRDKACWNPEGEINSETDVYFWINTNDGDKEMECIESVNNKVRLRKKCGWSILVQNIQTGDEYVLDESLRELRTFSGGMPASCLSDGTQGHWHRFGPIKLDAGNYEVAYENVGGSHSKWFVGPNVQSSKPLKDCTAPFPTFKEQRYRVATKKDATFIGKFEQKRPNNAGSEWSFLYKVPLDIGDNTPKNNHVSDACTTLDMTPLCSMASDATQISSPCKYMQQDLTGDNVFWHKVFDGECSGSGGSSKLQMYDTTTTPNSGTDIASRAKYCALACIEKKEPASASESWSNFHAVGFIVEPDTGECYCQSTETKDCTRVDNTFDRYDFNDWSNPILFSSNNWNVVSAGAGAGAGADIESKFHGSVLYAKGQSGITRYNDGITAQRWTPSEKRGGSTICYSSTSKSTRGEYYIDNVFTLPPSSMADNCATMEHYDTAGDDVSMLFGLCVDESEYHPVETVELGGLEVGSKHSVVVGAEAVQVSPPSRQFELWTGVSGPPGAMNIKQSSSKGGSITIFWNNPPSDRGGLGEAGDFEFSVFASGVDNPIRGLPPTGVVEGALVSLDAAVTSSFGRDFSGVWQGVSGWGVQTSGLVLLFDPVKYAQDGTLNTVSTTSFTLTKSVHLEAITSNGVPACDGSGASGLDRDTGFRVNKLEDGVVGGSSGSSWTIGGWIFKSAGAPSNQWHLFTDGGGNSNEHPNGVTSLGSGDILTIDETGKFITSMFDRFDGDNVEEVRYGDGDAANPLTWSSISYGWHELTVRYNHVTKNLRLFIDGIPEIGDGHTRTITADYWIRSFWGWGASSRNYKYDGSFGQTYAYNRALSDSDILFNHLGVAPSYGLSVGPFGTLEQCTVPFRPNDFQTETALGDGSRRTSPGLDCTWLQANGAKNSGEFWIQPQGSAPFKAYCDMVNDGGGWTLVYQRFNNHGTDVPTTNGPPIHQTDSSPAAAKSARLSDMLISKICTSQFRVEVPGHEDDNLYCRLDDPESFKDNVNTQKYCSVSGENGYSESSTSYTKSDGGENGFNTKDFNGAVKVREGENKNLSPSSACTENNGKCDARVWCKTKVIKQNIVCERRNLLESFKSEGFGAFGIGRKNFDVVRKIQLVGTEMCDTIEKSTDPKIEYNVEMWVRSHPESAMRLVNDKCFDATIDSIVQQSFCCKGGWCAGAHSLLTIEQNSGLAGVGFTVGDDSQWKAAGLSSGATSSNTDLDDIDFALYFSGVGVVFIYEKGILVKRVGTYKAGSRCTVIVNRYGSVEYSVGGKLLHTTIPSTTIQWPLHVDVSAFWDDAEGKTSVARLLDFHWVQGSGQPAKLGNGRRCAKTGVWLFTSMSSSMVGGMNMWMDGSISK